MSRATYQRPTLSRHRAPLASRRNSASEGGAYAAPQRSGSNPAKVTMDRRNFGKALVGGVAGAGLAATALIQPSPAQGDPLPRDMAYRVFPDLPVRRNDKIRT